MTPFLRSLQLGDLGVGRRVSGSLVSPMDEKEDFSRVVNGQKRGLYQSNRLLSPSCGGVGEVVTPL